MLLQVTGASMTYPYDARGCSGSTSTTEPAARPHSYDSPSRSVPTTTNTYPPPRPLQFVYDSRLRTREYDYLPFGGAYQPGTNVTVEQRYTYTGREKNPESALMYYRYRQYAPRVGRFGARDPIGHLLRSGLYMYVAGRPASVTDPFGLLGPKDVVDFFENLYEASKLPDKCGPFTNDPTIDKWYTCCEGLAAIAPGMMNVSKEKFLQLCFIAGWAMQGWKPPDEKPPVVALPPQQPPPPQPPPPQPPPPQPPPPQPPPPQPPPPQPPEPEPPPQEPPEPPPGNGQEEECVHCCIYTFRINMAGPAPTSSGYFGPGGGSARRRMRELSLEQECAGGWSATGICEGTTQTTTYTLIEDRKGPCPRD